MPIFENELDVSGLELNATYLLSVCSQGNFTLDDIVVTSNHSDKLSDDLLIECKNWNNYTLQRLDGKFQIRDGKHEPKDLPVASHDKPHLSTKSTKSKSFWKLQKSK